MQIDNLINRPNAANTTFRATITRGHINALNISAPLSSEVTVRVRSRNGSRVLMNALPLWWLSILSNIRHGYNNALTSQIEGQFTDKTAGFDIDSSVRSLSIAPVRVELGSFYLDSDELDVQIKTDSLDITEFQQSNTYDILCSAVSNEFSAHHILQYDIHYTADEVFRNSLMLLAYARKSGEKFYSGENPSFQVESSQGSYLATYRELLMNTLIDGNIEAITDLKRFMPVLHSENTQYPEDVQVKVSGSSAASTVFLNIQRIVLPEMQISTNQRIRKIVAEKRESYFTRNGFNYQVVKPVNKPAPRFGK